MKCKNCGTKWVKGNSFCEHCGAPKPKGKRKNFLILLLLLLIAGGVFLYFFLQKPEEESGGKSEEGNRVTPSTEEVDSAKQDFTQVLLSLAEIEDLEIRTEDGQQIASAKVKHPKFSDLMLAFLEQKDTAAYSEDKTAEVIAVFAEYLEENAEEAEWVTDTVEVNLYVAAFNRVYSSDFPDDGEEITPEEYEFSEDEIKELLVKKAAEQDVKECIAKLLEIVVESGELQLPEYWLEEE